MVFGPLHALTQNLQNDVIELKLFMPTLSLGGGLVMVSDWFVAIISSDFCGKIHKEV